MGSDPVLYLNRTGSYDLKNYIRFFQCLISNYFMIPTNFIVADLIID
jgi:hypothetical protein